MSGSGERAQSQGGIWPLAPGCPSSYRPKGTSGHPGSAQKHLLIVGFSFLAVTWKAPTSPNVPVIKVACTPPHGQCLDALASHGCCNRTSQTEGLKATEGYCLIVLEARSPKSMSAGLFSL